jgi:hypothetical protein
LHSSFITDPSGVPSSKYARRYQSPSQASSTIPVSQRASLRYRCARSARSRRAQIGANSFSTVMRNHPSHTLSPRPMWPTRFIPSFQSPDPMSGSPWAPNFIAQAMARTACSKSGACSAETRGSM